MEKDGRYKKVKLLFDGKLIKRFSEIFSEEVIPKTLLAKDLKKNNNQIDKLIRSPGSFKIKDVILISELFELTIARLLALLEPDHHDDYRVDHSQKDKRYKHIRTMFDKGEIGIFDHIFEHIPRTKVARDIGKSKAKIDLARLTYAQAARIAKLTELAPAEIFQLINEQIKQRKTVP